MYGSVACRRLRHRPTCGLRPMHVSAPRALRLENQLNASHAGSCDTRSPRDAMWHASCRGCLSSSRHVYYMRVACRHRTHCAARRACSAAEASLSSSRPKRPTCERWFPTNHVQNRQVAPQACTGWHACD